MPDYANGKICYIDIPATDITTSADFYRSVFGWEIRKRGDGHLAFNDGVNQVSGTWSVGRPPSTPGMIVFIMVENAEATCEAVIANGCEITQAIGADAPEITARFRDPGGNIMGIYQEPTLPQRPAAPVE